MLNTAESKHELRTVSELYRGACEYTRFPFTAQTGFLKTLQTQLSIPNRVQTLPTGPLHLF